ncbi:MAG: AMIN domain-containing protein [Desulfomonilaceae bacterium]
MKLSLLRYGAPALFCLFFIATYGQVWAAEPANITSVQVAPDLKQIAIKCDGPVGRNSAFVIQKPYRLVLDMESTGLGKIPPKINVGQNPLNEIRVGYANSRARVVMDFGDHPVPSFKIDRQANGLLVSLGVKAGAWQPRPAPKPTTQLKKDPVQHKPVASAPASQKGDSSKVVVKTAGVTDDLIFVELADKKDAKRTYRVVIDLDVERLQVRQTSVSDGQVHLKRFDLASSVSGNEDSVPHAQAGVGPRRTAGPTAAPSADHSKFKWGVQAGENRQAGASKMNAGPSIRVERFEPQPIQHQVAAEEG